MSTRRLVDIYKSKWLWIAIAVVALVIQLNPYAIGIVESDGKIFLYPWIEYIRTHGYWNAFADYFYDYSPLYVYFLGFFALSDIEPIILIKLFSIVFEVLMAFVVARMTMKALGYDSERKWMGYAVGALVLLLPSFAINVVWFAQCDSIFACFALLSVLLAVDRKWVWAFVAFGVAYSFKQQAIFVLPLFYYLFLKKEFPWYYLLIIPAIFILSLLPACALGRPFRGLITIYSAQRLVYHNLALVFPNFYFYIEQCIDNAEFDAIKDVIRDVMTVLVALGTLIAGYVMSKKVRAAITAKFCLQFVYVCTLLYPFILPGMHERYLFMADALSIAMIFLFPKKWRWFVAVPVISCIAVSVAAWHGPRWLFMPLPVALLAVVIFNIRFFVRNLKQWSNNDNLRPSGGEQIIPVARK